MAGKSHIFAPIIPPGQESSRSIPAILVTHTHWDREWYLTVEQLRPRLVRLFEHLHQILEEEPEYRCFWLDGQTIPLHDYWDTIGERPDWLNKALQEGKILIGPWYTLVDEWLSGGESIIRNLFEGRRTMTAYGQDNQIGYLPDSFGHISQMPAILAGFGIGNAFMHRGVGPGELAHVEFEWTAASGQSVDGIYLIDGYSNAQRIDADRHLSGERAGSLVKSIRELEQRTLTGVLLLLNGVDQALPTHRLARSIAVLATLLPELCLEQGSPGDYLALVRQRWPGPGQAPVMKGELPAAPQLDGTLSARVEQKIANRKVENLLAYYVEPLLALVSPEHRRQYRGMLRRAWALVMQSQAHDSICACHSDLVALDVMTRLSQARQLAENLAQELLVELLDTRPAEQTSRLPSVLVLWNPLPWRRDDLVEVIIYAPPGADVEQLVFEQAGNPIPSLITGRDEVCRWTEHYFGKVEHKALGTQRLQALIRPRLAGGAWANIVVKSAEDNQPAQVGLWREPNTLDNGLVRVVVQPDGRLDLIDLATDRHITGLNKIVDEIDRGNLYEHARSLSGEIHSPQPGRVYLVENSDLRAVAGLDTWIECNGLACSLELRVAVDAGSRLVKVTATLDNQAKDHWLRMVCPIPGQLQDLEAHTPFDLARRSVQNGAPYVDGERLRFAERLGQPMQWGVFARTDQGLLGLFNRGLYEYICEDETLLGISLMRFVGLIRPDLTGYSAEGANRLGLQQVEYAIGFWPHHQMADALHAMYEYNLPPGYVQIFDTPPGLLPEGVSWSNPYWLPSAQKPMEEGNGLVIRFWNAADTVQEGVIEYPGDLAAGRLARLDETPVNLLPARIVVRPKEIITILLPQQERE